MKAIKKTDELTYERAIEVLRYDVQNGVMERKLKSGRWKICGHKPNCKGYSQVGIDGKLYCTHRLIWLLVHGEWPERDIDHIDRDRMNNRIENLRPATKSENCHNQGLQSNNTSGYPGVYFDKRSGKYKSHITVHGQTIYQGMYPTAEEAYRAYQLAKIKYHPTSPIAQEYLRELSLAG